MPESSGHMCCVLARLFVYACQWCMMGNDVYWIILRVMLQIIVGIIVGPNAVISKYFIVLLVNILLVIY